MPNMSYCQFENTYRDLIQCLRAMNDDLSESETAYKRRLVDVCKDIVEEYELNKMSEVEWDEDNDNTQDDNNVVDDVPWDTQTK